MCKLVENPLARGQRCLGKLCFDRFLPQRPHVGQPHAVRREHTGERVDEYARHAQRVGNRARVLPPGAAEAAQGVFGDIVAALHRDVLDRVCHVLDGDLEVAFGDLLGRTHMAGLRGELRRERRELRAHRVAVEREIAGCAENLRE